MSIFHFKHFDVENLRSAMKVNTDGVLLGASAGCGFPEGGTEPVRVLDVGTGTGTVALMVAQRLSAMNRDFQVCGVDLDEASVAEATGNFARSPWSSHLQAFHQDFSSFSRRETPLWDLIVSNPPYFDTSLPAPDSRRNDARHTGTLSYRELMDYAREHLAPTGRLAVILPSDTEAALLRYGRMCSLFPHRILRVRSTPRKPVSRIVAEFSRERILPVENELVLQEEGHYTASYTRLVHDFYLWA